MLKKTETIAQMMQDNNEKLCGETLNNIVQLLSEKQDARNWYAEQRLRLDKEFSEVSHVFSHC